MASTNFKLFDENKTNMMSDTEYNINTQRLNGVQAGIASSQLQNKTLYQTSLVAYSLAQIMMQNGYDANDSVVVSSFVGNLSNSLLQKVLDKATSFEAQNGVNNTKWMSPALTKAAIDILAAKAQNILSDETKTLFGLGADAVPDDALSLLSRLNRGLCSDYLWEKYIEKHKDSYTETVHGSGDLFISVDANGSASRTFYYGDSYTINSDGTVTLTNQKTLTITDSQLTESALSVLVGKWFYSTMYGSLNHICDYIPAGSTITRTYRRPYYDFYSSKGWTHRENFSTQVDKQNLSYVNSPNIDTFPPAVSDGYTYSFCGRIGEKVVVEKGSYTGTGVEGKTLYFQTTPTLVIILSTSSSSLELSPGIFTTKSRLCVSYSLSDSGYYPIEVPLTWSENNTKVVISGTLFNYLSSVYDYFVFY